MRRKLLTTFGFDAEGQLVHVKDTQKGELYTCPQCGDRIIARNSGKIEKGSKRPHFAHVKKSKHKCNGASVLHHLFVTQVVGILQNHLERGKEFIIKWSCPYCSQMYAPNLLKKVKSIRTDYSWQGHTPDIALLDKDGKLLIAIEIPIRNKLTKKLIHAYEEQGIILIQVHPKETDITQVENKMQHPDYVGFCSNKECYNMQFYQHTIRRIIFHQPLKCKICNKVVDGYMVKTASAFGSLKRENLNEEEKKEIVNRYFRGKKATLANFVIYGKCKCVPYSKNLQAVKKG